MVIVVLETQKYVEQLPFRRFLWFWAMILPAFGGPDTGSGTTVIINIQSISSRSNSKSLDSCITPAYPVDHPYIIRIIVCLGLR